ncbi:hypothetical protein BC941DRAFT_477161 [Chlamydoabsidia padenii]|nr:hypothetical protein BC941DRAFT_477161 [Chlamydoabsidia padenii]
MAAPQPSDSKQKTPLGALEEVDEFEEFEAEDWAEVEDKDDTHYWEDNWDDDNIEDDFSHKLNWKKCRLQIQQ